MAAITLVLALLEPGDTLAITAGGQPVAIAPVWLTDGVARKKGLQEGLAAYGFDFSKQEPSLAGVIGIIGVLLGLGAWVNGACVFGAIARAGKIRVE